MTVKIGVPTSGSHAWEMGFPHIAHMPEKEHVSQGPKGPNTEKNEGGWKEGEGDESLPLQNDQGWGAVKTM